MNQTKVALFCELNIKPLNLDEFDDIIRNHALTCLDQESGCLEFTVGQSTEDPSIYHIFELYTDVNALDIHNNTDRFHALQEKIQPMMNKVTVVRAERLSGSAEKM